jgi:hypothetical protein
MIPGEADGHAYSSHPGLLRRAASGHAVAPPSSVMKLLRLTDRDHATAGPLKLVLKHRE